MKEPACVHVQVASVGITVKVSVSTNFLQLITCMPST